VIGRAAVGAGLIRIDGDTAAQAGVIEQLRVSPVFGNIVIVRGSGALKGLVDVWGSHGDRQPLFESLKRAFDPPACVTEEAASAGAQAPPSSGEAASSGAASRRAGVATTGTPGAFDADHAPDRALIDTCVHCGFCLPSCPTYVLWGEEMDSPRGRIYLMKAGLEGRTEMTTAFVNHFDACLGCMACVT
jgi:ferredoxin